MPFGMWTHVGLRKHVLDGGPDPHTRRGNCEDESGQPSTCSDMSRHIPGNWDHRIECWCQHSVDVGINFLQRLSRGQNRYGTDADCGVLDRVHIVATWRIRLNRRCAAAMRFYVKLETVSIAEPLQNRQHAPLMLSTLGSKEKREGG